MMLLIRGFAALAVVTMTTAIVASFFTASFFGDGAVLMGLAWGRVTLIDLYLALLTVWFWIAFRESTAARSVLWLIAVLTTGSLALGVYLLWASLTSDTPRQLLMGHNR